MDLDALRSFLAFIDTGSFTRAARQVHRTQSAVSMQMKKLEQAAGKPLFVKEGRLLALTQDGQVLARYARQLVQLHDDALAELHADAPPPVLRLGCPDDYVATVLPRLTPLLHGKWPALDLQVTCAPSHRIRTMLDNGELDVGVITRLPGSEEGLLLQSDSGVWVQRPGSALNLREPVPLALFQKDCKFHQAAVDGLLKQDRAFKVIAACSSAAALISLVSNGLAVGAMATMSMSPGLEIINDPELPALPVIDIVVVLSNAPHNPLSNELARELCRAYRADLTQQA